jgi:hypothetical protein
MKGYTVVNAAVKPPTFRYFRPGEKDVWVFPRDVEELINICDNSVTIEEYLENDEALIFHIYLPDGEISLREIIKGLPHIKTLEFYSFTGFHSVLSLEGIDELPFLKNIYFERNMGIKIKNDCFNGIEFCRSLKNLYLTCTGLRDVSGLAIIPLKSVRLQDNFIERLTGLHTEELYVSTGMLSKLDNDVAMTNCNIDILFVCHNWPVSINHDGNFIYRLASSENLKALLQSALNIQDRLRWRNPRSSVMFVNNNMINSLDSRVHSLDELMIRIKRVLPYIKKHGIPEFEDWIVE